jgi:hypothetical protein
MRINELLSETHQTDEGVGQFLGKAASAAAGAVGGVQGAWQGMKDVYGQKRDRVANVAQRNVQRSGGYRKPATTNAAPSPGGTTPTPPTAGTPPSTASGAEDPKALRAQAAELIQKADEIEKQAAAPISGSDRPYVAPPTASSGRVEPKIDTPAGTTTPPAEEKLPKFNKFTGEKFASPEDAKAFMNSPEYKMSHAEWEAAQAAKAPAPTSTAPAAPAPTSTAPAAPAPTSTAPAAPAPNYGSGQTQAPAPSKVNYSGIPKAAPVPQATPAQGAYSVKSAYGQPAPAAAPAAAPAPQFKGPKVNGLQVRNMGESKKLNFRSNFLGMDL